MHKFLYYNKFIICLYMFRALRAHQQEVKITQGESLARGPKLLSIKNYIIEIIT